MNTTKQLETFLAQLCKPATVSETCFVNCYYRNNPDGSIRWIWPAALSEPLFLRFYNSSGRRARMLVFLIRLLFALRMQRLFANGSITIQIKGPSKPWAFFAGTAGVNQTAVLYHENHFYKFPVGTDAQQLLLHEYEQLHYWQPARFHHIEIPRSSFKGSCLQQEDVAANGKREARLGEIHWNALAEISRFKSCSVQLNVLPEWKQAERFLDTAALPVDHRIPRGMLVKLNKLRLSIPGNTVVPAGFAHGDFTPWNIFVKKDRLALIDWELARPVMPLLHDAFHFIYQQASLVEHAGPESLQQLIHDSLLHPKAQSFILENNIDINLHHKLYLLLNLSYYLPLYARQSQWHPQVAMSLQAWNEALNHLLMKENLITARQLLISDVFDFLQQKEYAAMKWICAHPFDLPEDSDIDICISKKDTAALTRMLRRHVFVKKINVFSRSFMTSITVILKNDSLLNLDCIFEFKRKSLLMLNAAEVRSHATLNGYGIRIPAVEHDFTYNWLFYLLNGESIPLRYRKNFDFFSKPLRKKLNEAFSWHKPLNTRHYAEVFYYSSQNRKLVNDTLKKETANSGFSGWKNRLLYVTDSLRDVLFRRGFVVTFSGVDGAGKSTVIEKVKQQIEKKFRRRVVVLRHRPSILPMLTAFKEGSRTKAEQKAASTLPRQGTNKSTLSSILRFGYYYTDYLLGQFVVYCKYQLRGYIVLYDRYYFDFINDGKRSNINLPASLTRLGYFLLLKPRFNFFLYADAQLILQRKKEMDAKTISTLTHKYLGLFNRLGRLYRKSKYISIENNMLSPTLHTILHHVKPAALS